MNNLIYLASPHTHPDDAVVEERFIAACYTTGRLWRMGFRVFSPIVHTHPVWRYAQTTHCAQLRLLNELTHDDWMDIDEPFLHRCDLLIVLKLSGWGISRGVKREIKYFAGREKPIAYLAWEDIFRTPTRTVLEILEKQNVHPAPSSTYSAARRSH